jgi:hypothetical protein
MPAHQTRIAVLLVAYVLGCGALLGLGVSGGVQPPALVPVAIELADMNGRLPIELAADGAAALAGPVRPLVDGWAQLGSGAAGLSREVAPTVDVDRWFRNEIALLTMEFAFVQGAVAETRSAMLHADGDHADHVESADHSTANNASNQPVEVPPVAAADAMVAASAPSPPIVASPSERGIAALATMPVTPAELGYTITFRGPDPAFKGLTYPHAHHIDIFVRPSWSDHELAHVVAHELGHAVDVARNDLADHNRWRAARSIPAEIGWWADAFAADLETPGGDFAECFAAWALDEPKAATTPFGSCAGTAELMQELVHG